MLNLLTATIVFVCLSGMAAAQAPPPAPLQTPNPTYTTVDMEIDVNRPAADVWKRIGKFCDIGEWFQIPCTITSGKDGEFGAVGRWRTKSSSERPSCRTPTRSPFATGSRTTCITARSKRDP